MMKTGKNKRLLASILAASMLLAMSPFALAEGTEDTTGQEQSTSQPAKVKTEGSGTESGTTESGGTESGGTTTGGTESGGSTEGGSTEGGGGSESTGSESSGGTEQEKPETPVSAAKIGDIEYESIADAMKAANPGDTIKLLKDITESVKVEVARGFDGELTIDLNTYSINGDTANRCIWRTGTTNCWPQKLIVKNGTLKNASGGAIQWRGDLEVTDCRFEKNQGGAILSGSDILSGRGNTTIVNSTFEENQSGNAAGAAVQLTANVKCTITGSDFLGNATNTNRMGGAVYVDHGTLDITDCTFKGNSAGFGGAIAVADVEKLTIGNNTNCLDNKATSGGGGIYAIRSTATFEPGSALHGNSSAYGGAIYVDTSNINIAANSAVYNNTAATAGDDLFFFNKSTFTLPNAKDMSGDRILSSDKTEITGWYHDGWYKWNAAANDGQGGSEPIDRWSTKTADGYIDEYIPAEKDKPYITLKAAHPLMYTLTYDVTGDLPEGYTAPAKQTLVKGSSYTVAAVPASVSGSKDGVNGTFSFNGWKKDDGTVLTGEQKLTEDLTLYGVWTFTKKSSGGTDPIKWDVSRSKTATKLDTNTWTSNVTLSLPSAEEKLASDVVFVLDKSTSAEKEEQALGMLTALKEQTAKTGAKVKVGVVIFNKQANVTAPLTDLATGSETIEDAIKQKIKSGTNTHAGMLAGKQLLDEDTEVAANRKYLIFVSDGITYMYNAEPTVTAWSFFADAWKHWAGPDNWDSKYGSNNPPADWSAWMTEIGKQVETQGTEYEYPYDGTAEKWTPEDDSSKNYANSIDKALYSTYQVYQEAQEAGYNCYAVANEVEHKYLWGPAFMRYLANGETVNFDKIQNDILYAVSAGSKVTDTIGEKFTFGGVDSFTLKVGTKEIKGVKDASDENTVNFGEKKKDGKYPYTVTYTPATKTFVWTINENVSNFAPVQLTYTVKLTKPETAPGTYGTEDLKGEKNVPSDKALFTNKCAVLKAINSAGATLNPLDFPKPSVSYTVKKSSSGGGGGGGRKPTVTIPDDVPTGLNGDDHYAYIVGYPNGNVEPNGNITRAEVATIFFRLLTEKVRTANSTQSNSLSDVTRGQWFNHAVSTLSSMGIVKGHNDGTFAPNAPITRAEFAAIAARFDDKNRDTSSKFTDIASHWAKNEIGIAANKGWINGYPDGTFRPNQYITRAEAMTLVNRVLNRLPENSSDLLDSMIKWPDNSDASAWYYLAVQEATNSHYYKTKENKFEKWTELRKTRDWTELEK